MVIFLLFVILKVKGEKMMRQLEKLKLEVSAPPAYAGGINEVLCAEGFTAHYDAPSPLARAYGIERLFTGHPKYI